MIHFGTGYQEHMQGSFRVYKIKVKLQLNNIDFLALPKTRTYRCLWHLWVVKLTTVLSALFQVKSRFSETQVAFDLQNQEEEEQKKQGTHEYDPQVFGLHKEAM